MPYIKPENRTNLKHQIYKLINSISNYGELNYAITSLCLYMPLDCYEDYMKIIGTLECAKLEFYRRAVAEYEDKEIEENGDCY